jgi:hypothetical protein
VKHSLRPSFLFFALLLALPALRAQLTFDPANPPSSATPPTEIYHAYNGLWAHQKGPKTLLVFLVRPSDGAAWSNPPTLQGLDAQLTTTSRNFYEMSYRQTWFGPKRLNNLDIPRLVVTPVLNLPATTSAYLNSFGLLQAHCLAAARALGGDHFDRPRLRQRPFFLGGWQPQRRCNRARVGAQLGSHSRQRLVSPRRPASSRRRPILLRLQRRRR